MTANPFMRRTLEPLKHTQMLVGKLNNISISDGLLIMARGAIRTRKLTFKRFEYCKGLEIYKGTVLRN